jgi:hypothetical protein
MQSLRITRRQTKQNPHCKPDYYLGYFVTDEVSTGAGVVKIQAVHDHMARIATGPRIR